MRNKIVGVVAEFNPFHNGHKYQIDEIKKYSPLLTVAIISGNFTQRGEISFLSKDEKTKIALLNGYDLILELPVYYSIQNAEIFCEYSTRILAEIGIQIQVFGIENDNLNEIEKIVSLKKNKDYNEKIKRNLKLGYNYIDSHKFALREYGIDENYKSNNILAIEYIESIKRNNLNIKYFPLKRINVEYNGMEIKGNISSASYIRKEINNINNLKNVMVYESYETLKNKNINENILNNKLYNLFKYTFYTNSKEKILNIYDFNDNIYNRIFKTLNISSTYEEFLNNMKVRNLSINRIKRLILNLLLEINKSDISKNNEIEYIRVLGFNEKGAKYIKKIDNSKIYVNWKDIEKSKSKYIKIEKKAFLLYNILTKNKEKLNPVIKESE